MVIAMKIIFDVDGTLFEAFKIALPAFQKVLEHYNKTYSEVELKDMLGRPNLEIWATLLPEEDEDGRQRAFALMDEEELNLIKNDAGQLYDDVKATLKTLFDQGHQLYTLSNCAIEYLHTIVEHFGLQAYFTELICADHYPGESKVQILARILQGETDAVMIGDRFHDIIAGKVNQVATIWCSYGYGLKSEIMGADYTVSRFVEILPIIESLSRRESNA